MLPTADSQGSTSHGESRSTTSDPVVCGGQGSSGVVLFCRHESQQREAEEERLRKEKADKEAADQAATDKAAAGWTCCCSLYFDEPA